MAQQLILPPETPTPSPHTYKPWKQVLQECGYPTRVVVVDSETYFDEEYSLKNMSQVGYILDERFEELAWVYKFEDGHPHFEWRQRYHKDQLGDYADKFTFVMHHAQFDAAILAYRYGLHPKYIVDTLALSRAWKARCSHSLKDLASLVGAEPKGDTQTFKGWTFRERYYKSDRSKQPKQRPIMTNEMLAQLEEYAGNDAEITWKLFEYLLPRLSNPQQELALMDHTLRLYTKPTLRFDIPAGEALKVKMQAELDKAVAKTGLPIEDISGNLSFEQKLTRALEDAHDNPLAYLKVAKKGLKLAEAKDDVAREWLLHHQDERVRDLFNARVAVKSWPLHIGRVDNILALAKSTSGLAPIYLRYHGAHTGRYSGGDDLNFQNMGKNGLIGEIRHLIVPPSDHKLLIVDLAQIEARVLAWLAGQDDLIVAFRDDADPYSDFATDFYKSPVRRPRKGGIPTVEKLMDQRRQFGKTAILGLGYGMGAEHLAEVATQKGIPTDIPTAKSAVDLYRRKYAEIPRLWNEVERLFARAGTSGRLQQSNQGIRFSSRPDCKVVITLPNGRELHYHRVTFPDRKINVWDDKLGYPVPTWGGSLVENLCQAIARDILTAGTIELEELGWHTALSVHDEVVLVIPESVVEAIPAVHSVMCRNRSWHDGLPLAIEVKIADRYGK